MKLIYTDWKNESIVLSEDWASTNLLESDTFRVLWQPLQKLSLGFYPHPNCKISGTFVAGKWLHDTYILYNEDTKQKIFQIKVVD